MKEDEKQSNRIFSEFTKGIFKENPIFVLLIGMCPTLAVSTIVANGIGMGIAASLVLIGSNLLISLLRDYIPEKVRIPAYIVIIASFVTIIDMLLKAFSPFLSKSLGIFVPLIVVNCIILGRAEAFAGKNKVIESVMDALGMGLGFIIALLIISFIREIFGSLQIDFTGYGAKDVFTLPIVDKETSSIVLRNIFGQDIEVYRGISILILPAGAFFILALILAVINAINYKKLDKEKK